MLLIVLNKNEFVHCLQKTVKFTQNLKNYKFSVPY